MSKTETFSQREQSICQLEEEFPFLKGKINFMLHYGGYWKKDSEKLSEFGETYLKYLKKSYSQEDVKDKINSWDEFVESTRKINWLEEEGS